MQTLSPTPVLIDEVRNAIPGDSPRASDAGRIGDLAKRDPGRIGDETDARLLAQARAVKDTV